MNTQLNTQSNAADKSNLLAANTQSLNSANRESFVFHAEWCDILDDCPADVKSQVIIAAINYALRGLVPDFSGMASMAFKIIRKRIDYDKMLYVKRCEKNRKNISKRWDRLKNSKLDEKSIPQSTVEYHNDTKNTDTDNDTDNDIETESESDTETDSDVDDDDVESIPATNATDLVDNNYSSSLQDDKRFWLAATSILKRPEGELRALIPDFDLRNAAVGKTHASYSDYKDHAINWLNKQPLDKQPEAEIEQRRKRMEQQIAEERRQEREQIAADNADSTSWDDFAAAQGFKGSAVDYFKQSLANLSA